MTSRLPRLLLASLLLGTILLAVGNRDALDAASLQRWIAGYGSVGPLVFVALYALGTVIFLPGSVITLAGGALFGPILGTFCNLTGATLGAAIAFLIARYLAADWVAARVGGRLRQLMEGVEREGWRFVAFTRLVPLFPFNLLNYAFGLTRVHFGHYLLATYLCMLPGAIAYSYLGYAGREAVAGGEGMIGKGLLALALLAIIAFLPRLIGALRAGPFVPVEVLKQRLDAHDGLRLLDVRSAADFSGDQGHIAGAVNMPLEALADRQKELATDPDRPILIVCTTDRRSAKAARQLIAAGFAEVQVVAGGMTAWRARGWPVEVSGTGQAL